MSTTTKLTAAEEAAMAEGRRATQEMIKRIGTPGKNYLQVDKLEGTTDERVTMMVPRQFLLTLDDHRQIQFPAGVCSVPVEVELEIKPKAGESKRTALVADNWYVKAHGVKPYTGPAAKAAPQVVEVRVPTPILGSATLSPVKVGKLTIGVGEATLAAHKASGLSAEDWNALPEDHRDELISEQMAAMKKAATATATDGKKDDKGDGADKT